MTGTAPNVVANNDDESKSTEQDELQQHRFLPNSGLLALAFVARRYRIGAEPRHLAHELGLGGKTASGEDVVRAAQHIGLKARLLNGQTERRLTTAPTPALLLMRDGSFAVLAVRLPAGEYRLFDPVRQSLTEVPPDKIEEIWAGDIILITRRAGGPGIDPGAFSFRWFVPSIWRYRKSLVHVLVASLFIQAFALVSNKHLCPNSVLRHKQEVLLLLLCE
jgi:subfamily B ATP-binding cassette protein HlyB/CyaB